MDAAIILGFNVLTAAQTGNTILLAVAIAERHFATGFYAAASVITYVLGSAVGELVVIASSKSAWPYPIASALFAELLPLGALIACWHLAGGSQSPALIAGLVALAAIAMGIQSTAALRLHSGPTTTYVTGTLTTFATRTVQWQLGKATPSAVSQQEPRAWLSTNAPVIYGLDWLVYAGGAVASALLFLRIRELALVLPVTAIAAAVLACIGQTENNEENR